MWVVAEVAAEAAAVVLAREHKVDHRRAVEIVESADERESRGAPVYAAHAQVLRDGKLISGAVA